MITGIFLKRNCGVHCKRKHSAYVATMALQRRMSGFLFLTVEVDAQGLTGDNSLTTYIFQRDGVAKIAEVAKIGETALTGEEGKGYMMPPSYNTERQPEDPKRPHMVRPSPPLGGVIEEVIQSIEIVDIKLKEFFEIHGTDLQIAREIGSNSRRRK
jgi:hypothetical protein